MKWTNNGNQTKPNPGNAKQYKYQGGILNTKGNLKDHKKSNCSSTKDISEAGNNSQFKVAYRWKQFAN